VIGQAAISRPLPSCRAVGVEMMHEDGVYRLLFEHSAHGLTLQQDEKVILVNPRFADMVGYTRQELLDFSIDDVLNLIHPHDREAVLKSLRDLAAGQVGSGTCDCRYLRRTGETGWWSVTLSTFEHEGRPAILSAYVDITQRKQAEAAAERQSQLLAATLDVLPVGVCLNDEAGYYRMMNSAYCAIYEYDRAEMLGRHYSVIMPPDQIALANAHYAQMLGGNVSLPVERKRQRKDGRIVYIEAANALVEDADGHKMVITTVRDITERSQTNAALKQLNAELQVRNEDLNAFAHTVAHDLKNPITVILGFAEILRDDFKALPPQELADYLDQIARHGCKMRSIVNGLLLLSSVRDMDEVPTAPLDMPAIIAEAQASLRAMFADYQAEIRLPESWPVALGYGPWVEEVWVNYLSNALKYGGSPPRLALGADEPSAGQVRFWVTDNGRGLSAAEQLRVFKPFERLGQQRMTGHGLGLSIVRRIIEKLGGQVGVDSEVGRGSTFYFTLPRSAAS
jgi:PAS domain S-box-containing protein